MTRKCQCPGDGVDGEAKTLLDVQGLSWRLILGLGALPGAAAWHQGTVDHHGEPFRCGDFGGKNC